MALDTIAGKGLAQQIGQLGDVARQSGTSPSQGLDRTVGTDFRNALDQAVRGTAGGPSPATAGITGPGAAAAPSQLKFSAHAVERMRSRGISFAPEMMKSIEGAIQKAAQKGSKDTLVLAGDSALIVSVKNNTVVTVMDKASMRENVFTNIDSTVVI